jgi:hypothetical protein
MTIEEIGCCGAYCKTCIAWQKKKYPNEKTCLGCKLGYEQGKRDASKAKCKIKVCCFVKRKLETCVDCPNYPCEILEAFWNKKGWKYKQYKKQLEFIKQSGYEKFLGVSDNWKGPSGKLEM